MDRKYPTLRSGINNIIVLIADSCFGGGGKDGGSSVTEDPVLFPAGLRITVRPATTNQPETQSQLRRYDRPLQRATC